MTPNRPREAGVTQARSPSNPTPSPHLCSRGANPFPQSPATGAGVSNLTLTLRQSCLPPPTGAGWEEAVPGALPRLGHTELHPAGPVGQAGPNHRADRCGSMRPRSEVVSNRPKLPAALNNGQPLPPAFPFTPSLAPSPISS